MLKKSSCAYSNILRVSGLYDLLKLAVCILFGYFFSFAVSFCHLNELKHFLNSNKKKRVNTRKNLLFPTNDGHFSRDIL